MKKIVAILLAVLMILPAMVACDTDAPAQDTTANTSDSTTEAATDDTTTEADTTPDTSDFVMDDLVTMNYDGASFKMYSDQGSIKHIFSEEMTSDPVKDALFLGRDAVENRFNCAISVELVNNSEIELFTTQLVATADDSYALCFCDDLEIIRMRDAGNNYNLKNFTQFDFEDPWWIDSTELLSIGDSYRVASSFLTASSLGESFIFLVNKNVAEEYHVEIPYEKVFAGNWYLDDLIAMIKQVSDDANGDGLWDENDVYGIAGSLGHGALQISMNIDYIIKDENNNPIVNENLTDRVVVYLEKLASLEGLHVIGETKNAQKMIANGNALMTYIYLQFVEQTVNSADFSYGFLIPPKLDEHQEEYIVGASDKLWCVPLSAPSNTDRQDFVGTIIEALQCQNYNRVLPAYFETVMKFRMAESPDDSKMLSMVPAAIRTSIAGAMGLTGSNFYQETNAAQAASYLKRYIKSVNRQLKTIAEANNDME